VFEVPVLSSDLKTAPANNSVSWFESVATEAFTTATPVAYLLQTIKADGIGCSPNASTGVMTPPAGNYLIDFWSSSDDTASETFRVLLDVNKNGVSILNNGGTSIVPGAVDPSIGTTSNLGAAGSAFVSANGTDQFKLIGELVGAAGTLTSTGSIRWTAA